MRKLLILLIPLLTITACSIPREPRPTVPAPSQTPRSTESPPPPINTPIPEPIPTPIAESVDVYNFLLLGGDYREHRQGTRYGDKTDVMLLVSIRMEDRPVITVLQFNRNFYHPIEAMDDMWLFHVYGREGFVGLHYYFQQVFDVDLHGIAYINMDKFESFVDALGGIWMGTPLFGHDDTYAGMITGTETLAYLRDNENNWGCYVYDCENRQFKVLVALAEKIKTKFHEDPLTTARFLWDAYGGLFETDLSEFEQIHWLIELGWKIATSDYQIDGIFKMDNSPYFIYDDTPLEVRGWIQREGYDIQEWAKRYIGG